MAMRGDLTKIQILTVLGAILILGLGCASDEESIVEPDISIEPDISTQEPAPSTVTGSLKGAVETIEGVSVVIRVLQNDNAIASATVDNDGNYRIDNIAPGTYTVEIVAKGYEAVEHTVQVDGEQVAAVDRVTLKVIEIPVSHVQGILSNQQNGAPLNRIRVRLVDAAGNHREVLTTQTGEFEFENVPTDQQLTVIVDVEGFEQQEIAVDPIPAGETVPLNIALVALPGIRGLVLDQITKTPLVDVRVQLTDEVGKIIETPTTRTGVFEFEGVAPNQRLTVTIDSDRYQKREFIVDPIPIGETVKLQVELIPLDPDQLPEGDGLIVGVKAPDFNLSDSDGNMIALADYVGKKKVVLVFDRGEW